MIVLIQILGCYFLLGALLIMLIRSKKNTAGQTSSLWVKYWVYLSIVSLVLSLIYFGFAFPFAIVLAIGGLFEMIIAWLNGSFRKPLVLIAGLLVYLPVAFLFLRFTNHFNGGENNMLIALAYTGAVIFDGFSQLSGQLLGKRKMTPRISPNKTWAGFIGGAIMSLMTILVFMLLSPEPDADLKTSSVLLVWMYIVPCLAGDLLASLYKRKCGMKDFSALIPGHGGILDRFDSTIMLMACIYVVGWCC